VVSGGSAISRSHAVAIAVLVAAVLFLQPVWLEATASADAPQTRADNPGPTAPLRADYTFEPSRPVVGETVYFNATATGGQQPYNYSWDFGDGSNATGPQVTHAFASAVRFTVVLTVTDAANNTATVAKDVPVSPPLTADFTFSPTQPVVGEAVTFTATESGGSMPYTYAWAFGDGATGSGTPIIGHTYASEGTFTVTLTVTDDAGHVATKSKPVTVTPVLVADFTFSPDKPAVGETITFSGNATGGTEPYSFAWDFGDGGTASGLTATHAYASPDTYTVTLTVTDDAGHLDTSAKPVSVTAALTADFTFAPALPVVGETITFSGNATGGTEPYSFAWDFGDGGTASGATATHAYAGSDTYAVTLTVADDASHVASATKSVRVTSGIGLDFTFSPAQPVVAETISFVGTAAGGTPPYTFTWDFGDGATASGSTATHAFALSGTFNVVLTVSDSAGHVDSVTKPVSVAPALIADFGFSPTQPAIGDTVSFAGTATGGIPPLAFAWDFGDGGTATGANATHAYGAAGTYAVTFTVSDSANHVTSNVKSISVSSELAVDFSISPDTPVLGEVITFTASASGGTPPYAYLWEFGDGVAASGPTTTHAYAASGMYSVRLNVSDSEAHSAAIVISLYVAPLLNATFAYVPTLPLTFERIDFDASASGGTPPYSYVWDFGDGLGAFGPSVNHAYTAAGFYTVTLTATDSLARVVEVVQTIGVSFLLAADFTISQVFPVVGEVVNFSAEARGASPPYTFSWNFGDRSTASGPNVSHAYAATGAFTVTLVVSDSEGHSANVAKPVVVTSFLVADFTYAPEKPTVGEAILFTGAPAGATPPYVYAWTFGDGSNGTGSKISHAYATVGAFNVTLSVTDSARHRANVTIAVAVTPALTGNFTFTPNEPVAFEEIAFAANASGATPPYAFAWSFGDRETAEGANVSHAYRFAQFYPVTLTITDSAGHSLRAAQWIQIGPALAVDFSFSRTESVAGHSFAFSANASGGAAPYTYEWHFGDGAVGQGDRVNHSYADFGSAGAYQVVLTVCDSMGRCTSVTKSVRAQNPVIVAIFAEVGLAALILFTAVLRRRPRATEPA